MIYTNEMGGRGALSTERLVRVSSKDTSRKPAIDSAGRKLLDPTKCDDQELRTSLSPSHGCDLAHVGFSSASRTALGCIWHPHLVREVLSSIRQECSSPRFVLLICQKPDQSSIVSARDVANIFDS